VSDTWIDALDFFICPFYIIAVYMYALNIVRRNRSKKPYYRFLLPALMCKIIGGISLCLIYTYYYTYGGDATNYFISANTFSNVLLSGDFSLFVELMSYKKQNVYDVLAYTDKYGYFMFSPHDYYALFTVWLTVPFVLLGCKSILASTVLLASLSFVGLWKLYEVFRNFRR
jgi:hypothetical protein